MGHIPLGILCAFGMIDNLQLPIFEQGPFDRRLHRGGDQGKLEGRMIAKTGPA